MHLSLSLCDLHHIPTCFGIYKITFINIYFTTYNTFSHFSRPWKLLLRVIRVTLGLCALLSHRCELVLVPQRADNESHQTTLLKPAQRQLWTEGEEVTHLVQVERTLAGHRDEGCEEEEKTHKFYFGVL